MNKQILLERLKQQKQRQEQELIQNIVNIENTIASLQVLEGQEIQQAHFPPQNPFEGVPINRINTETYLTIARLLVNNTDNVRTPGINKKLVVKELNTRIGELEQIINSFDNTAEQLSVRCDTSSQRQLRQMQDDRDTLRIELEFYRDIIEALQPHSKLTKEEIEEGKQKAKDWYNRRISK
jgi:hypothetical protein